MLDGNKYHIYHRHVSKNRCTGIWLKNIITGMMGNKLENHIVVQCIYLYHSEWPVLHLEIHIVIYIYNMGIKLYCRILYLSQWMTGINFWKSYCCIYRSQRKTGI